MKKDRHVIIALVLVALFSLAAFLLPRHAVRGNGGLAAAGTAALIFLSFLFLAFLAATYAFVSAWRQRANMTAFVFYAGLVPLPCLLTATAIFWIQIMMKPEPPSDLLHSAPTTPAAVQPHTTEPLRE